MDDMNRLGHLILKHWTTHRPAMVEELERTNQLQPVLRQAQEQTGDLLYTLTVIQKMDYQAAWELATREWAFLPEEDRPEPAIIRQAEPEPDLFPSRDFRITDADRIGEGSLRDKAFDNIEAIRALKRIEAESRAATDAEKSLLVKYTGWGAMANAFRPYPPPEWQHTATELRELLTAAEYDSARASTPNAHYTSPAVIESIWQAMQRFGLRPGAQILEPSMGVGHFFGLMPDELLPGSRRTGVELDSITARIAKCLYPDSTLFAKGFEDTPLPDNFFDAVIGNIPVRQLCGSRSRLSAHARSHPHHSRLFPGEVSRQGPARRRPGSHHQPLHHGQAGRDDPPLSRRARRPHRRDPASQHNLQSERGNGSHDRHSVSAKAGACARAHAGASANGESWQDLAAIETPDGPVSINEYFVRHPEMMLGTMRLERGLYSAREPTLAGEFSPERLATAIASLPTNIYPRSEDRPPRATSPRRRAPQSRP